MGKVLVTGGAGFIGSHLVDHLVARGDTVRVLDSLNPQVHPAGKRPAHIPTEVEFIHGDICDRQILEKALAGTEEVYHFAGAVGVGQSQYQVAHYIHSNALGTGLLFDVLVNDAGRSVRKVVVASSMSCYGEGRSDCLKCGRVRPPLRSAEQMQRCDWDVYCPNCRSRLRPLPTPETEPFAPNSIYALTKQTTEDIALVLGPAYDLPTVSLRYFNVFGPRQSLSNPYNGVMAIFLSRLKNGRSPIVYEDGHQLRDFISVHDVVRATASAMRRDQANYQRINVGSGTPREIGDVALTLARVLGVEIEPDVTGQFRKGDVRACYAEIAQARALLAWEPATAFEDNVRELIDWGREERAEDRYEAAHQELVRKGLI